ncbi:MAG TPA: sulfatase-like hydrolase/transferase, partial [Verrucomicrobiae bacterium]
MKLNRLFLLGGLLSLAFTAAAEEESATAIFSNAAKHAAAPTVFPRRTSFIFIACDGLHLGDLSCYGQTNFQTPNLDRLAREGTRFTDYHAGGDDLAQAQATLMAGKDTASLAGET